ncbi:EAL domain-containing protein [Candidatus Methylospira mobilis]|uniref:cyclic-guanylate-specific phosphodiesterase n=2 Tax=Candidatus Methylospira mobilis TaxID=1808979 RepID=A0A5Q0BLF9_9GAMM|nr:EAL domain-containing protein [Candidatus Methylospira mobilis]QFY43962.1 EAL domain-containing protein [Candidatus Methylospira mobilis]WNV04967.1 EAL domain-containing protein [Candidatus Methylospira mobilis]
MPYAGSNISLFWLPAGIAVAVLLRWGRTYWPGVFVGAFVGDLFIGVPVLSAAGLATGGTLAPLLIAGVLGRAGFHAEFDRQKDIPLFCLAAAAGTLVSALSGAIILWLAGPAPSGRFINAALAWWMGDFIGVLLAGPLLLTLTSKNLTAMRRHSLEFLLWSLLAALLGWGALHADSGGVLLPMALLSLPMAVWAALRFEATGSAFAVTMFSLVAAWLAAGQATPFSQLTLEQGMLLLWVYILTLVLSELAITALLAGRGQAEAELRRNEEKLRGFYELAPLGIALNSMDGRYMEFNEAFRKICGYSEQELKALDYWMLTPKEYHDQEAIQLEFLAQTGRYGPYEKTCRQKSGRLIPVQLNGMLVTGKDGEQYIWSIVQDITERNQTRRNQELIHVAINKSCAGFFWLSPRGRVVYANEYACESLGYAREDLVGLSIWDIDPDSSPGIWFAAWEKLKSLGSSQSESRQRRKDGAIFPVEVTSSYIAYAGEEYSFVFAQNIAEKKRKDALIWEQANFDPLTNLPNRRLLGDRVHQAMSASARSGRYGALVLLDLDQFKRLNDSMGHSIGDKMLIEVARRLKECVRAEDSVARLGGDEFVVLLSLSSNSDEAAVQAETVAEKIRGDLCRPFRLGDVEYHITPSVGVVLFRGHQDSLENLLIYADTAMYQAKSNGRNTWCFYDPSIQAALEARNQLESALRSALDRQEFRLFYQLQQDISGHPLGVEALLRWVHPALGPVTPAQFIPVAEDTGLIQSIGRWVIDVACAQLAKWRSEPGLSRLSIAVNVSARQFREKGFVDYISLCMRKYAIDPVKLELELTESMVLDDVEGCILKMRQLRTLGVRFSMDDFGTGYSSLLYLKQLPLDQIKIDQSFVRDIIIDHNDAAIVQAIIAMSHSLGLDVIAEGVETDAQYAFLRQYGCDAYQGYFFGRPMPVDELEAAIRKHPATDFGFGDEAAETGGSVSFD